MGTPLPLGLLGLFMASLLFSARQLHWVPTAQENLVLLAVLAFSVPLQAVACLFGFLARDPAAATGMGVLCGIWAATTIAGLTTVPGSTSAALGILLIAGAGALLVPIVVAVAGKVLAAIVIGAAALR
ncbi:MAG: hypothetical protein ACRDQ5_11360, partial [Sciscionella sp.]